MKGIRRIILLGLLSPLFLFGQQPKLEMLTTGTATSLRGLSVVSDEVIWVSGSKGTIGRSVDGGQTWKWSVVTGFEKMISAILKPLMRIPPSS